MIERCDVGQVVDVYLDCNFNNLGLVSKVEILIIDMTEIEFEI